MRIAFDGKKAARNRAGLGNYSRFVIGCMAERYPDSNFDVYVRKDTPLLDPLRKYPNVTVCTPQMPLYKTFPLLWERFGLPAELRRRRTDLFHGLGNTLPAGLAKSGVRTVVTIHDLIFLFFPQTYSWANRHIFNLRFRKACREADKVVAVSRCTAKDIHKYYRTDPSRIEVAYQGCNASFRQDCSPESLEEVRSRYHLPERFILSVGTIEERKNTGLIVKALRHLPGLDLVLVGRRTKYTLLVEKMADAEGVRDRVHILSGVGGKDLPAIYRLASVFAYPSRYEGFGIPVLEALCSGVPVVAATGSCLEEAGGDAAFYVSPDDDADLARKVSSILSDPQLKASMVEKGFRHAGAFTDEALAERLMSIYEDVMSR